MGRGQSGQWSEALLCPVTHMENWHESLVYTPWICTVAAIIRQNLLLSPAFPLGAAALNWLWCYVEHLQRYVWDSLLSAQNMADRCCCSSRRLHCFRRRHSIHHLAWFELMKEQFIMSHLQLSTSLLVVSLSTQMAYGWHPLWPKFGSTLALSSNFSFTHFRSWILHLNFSSRVF